MTIVTKQGVTTIRADVPFHTAPAIKSIFTDKQGNEHYQLANGRSSLKSVYDNLWLPKKGKCNFNKSYKGENPDGTKIPY
jgi:hypothetical protein